MEKGAAPRCMIAASARWNSGRLLSISATVVPRPTPILASPAASSDTRSAYSPQVQLNSSCRVRIAVRSGYAAAVAWKASHAVRASNAAGRPVVLPRVSTCIPPGSLPERSSAHSACVEAAVRERAQVVRETHREQDHHEQEAHGAGPFHDPERKRSRPDLLDQAPEDVAGVERQERKQVDDREREADQGDQAKRLSHAELERLMRHVRDPDDPVDLLALLGLEDLPENADR